MVWVKWMINYYIFYIIIKLKMNLNLKREVNNNGVFNKIECGLVCKYFSVYC